MQLQNIYTLGSLINLAVVLLSIVAGFYVFKKSVIRETNLIHTQTAEAQESAINAMREEIITLKTKLEEAKVEIKRLNNLLQTIAIVARTKGFTIEIDDEIVHVRDDHGNSSHTRINGGV
jgi:5-bromo-4-chloroindolyl phosphate hydrolysis protein